MGRIYAVPFAGATVTNAGGNNDLWIFEPADDKPIKLRGFRIGQISEVGDAAEEGLELQVIHMTGTVTNGNGGAVTPVPLPNPTGTAAGFTSETNGTTVATTSGATTIVEPVPWNVRATPCDFWPPDERFCLAARQGEAIIIRLITTVADDITFAGVAWIEEE